RARRRLAGESREPLPESRISAITTASPRAWDLFFQAVRARDESRLDDAAKLAQEAQVEDLGFALARFLALDATWTVWGNDQDGWLDPDTELETRKALEKVEAAADRLPEKERLSLRAMRASLEKQWAVAGEIRDRVSALYPLDKEAVFLAGVVRYHSEAFAEAIPYFRRSLQLDPGFRLAAYHLEWSLTNIGRAAEEVDWLRAQVPLVRSSEEERALFWAFLSAGQEDDARRMQDAANARIGRTSVWPALALYWVHHGRAPEAERAIRESIAAKRARESAAGKPHTPNWRLPYVLAQSLAAQGRFREAIQVSSDPDWGSDPRYRFLQQGQWAAAGRQDHAQLEALTRELANQGTFSGKDGGNWLEGPKSAVVTAMAGRLDLAAQTARAVLDGSAVRGLTAPERAFMEAILAASESRSRGSPPELVAIAEHPQVWWRFPGNVVLGHDLRARGDCPGAIAAYERASAIPWHWLVGEKSHLFPFVLHSLATCYEKTGDLVKARERNAELLKRWEMADEDIPLLVDAKAMRERLAVK
ncbi:MAG TPA: hypothetical protein VFM45_07120, partial [Anaeromyxobacteraceae bacterium]|nr:hypothetical protein [Anaeromyxobacteraceae bacterium]